MVDRETRGLRTRPSRPGSRRGSPDRQHRADRSVLPQRRNADEACGMTDPWCAYLELALIARLRIGDTGRELRSVDPIPPVRSWPKCVQTNGQGGDDDAGISV